MKRLIKFILQQAGIMIISLVVMMGLSFVMFTTIGLFLGDGKLAIKDDSILVMDLSMVISDSPKTLSPIEIFKEALNGNELPTHSLKSIIDALDNAADDDKISGLYLHGNLSTENLGSSYAAIREVSEAISRFKETGKPVIGYLVSPSIRDYLLTSSADKLFLNPMGLISLNGLSSEIFYLKNALDKYGIGVQTVSSGKYKSAIEIFTRENMSAEDRLQTEQLLGSIWNEITTNISGNRNIDLAKLVRLSDKHGLFNADLALEHGLVDELQYLDHVINELAKIAPYDDAVESFAQVKLKQYIQHTNSVFDSIPNKDENKVAVVYAQGNIVNGEGVTNQIGGNRVARLLRDIRKDDTVKAVVLRVNSPGGSALASEIIEREVDLLNKTKPVVVSMGAYAASGGYWISAQANTIFAEPTTITGSIGVFGLIPNIKNLANSLGVNFDGVKTSPYANIYSISNPKNNKEISMLQKITNEIYTKFITKVSNGRKLTLDEVKNIAQGRVWSGQDAVDIGLVDRLGGLQDSIRHAAGLANLTDNWKLIEYPREKHFPELLNEILEKQKNGSPVSQQSLVTQTFEQFNEVFETVKSFDDPRGVYARLPFTLQLN